MDKNDKGMVRKRIYLSGPISGYDIEERRKTFASKKRELSMLGYEVMNPMENGLAVGSSTYAHMRRDFEMLLTCDSAYFMDKWLHSAGCKVEFDVATACGMEVFFEVIDGHSNDYSVVRFQ